jgi:hypothetical protein
MEDKRLMNKADYHNIKIANFDKHLSTLIPLDYEDTPDFRLSAAQGNKKFGVSM